MRENTGYLSFFIFPSWFPGFLINVLLVSNQNKTGEVSLYLGMAVGE